MAMIPVDWKWGTGETKNMFSFQYKSKQWKMMSKVLETSLWNKHSNNWVKIENKTNYSHMANIAGNPKAESTVLVVKMDGSFW